MQLETERLHLRALEPGDVSSLVQLWSDPGVTRFMGGPRDRADLEKNFAEELQADTVEVYDLWPVVEKASGQVIGHCGLLDKEIEGTLEIELTYVFAPATWGKGYATEIAQALKEYAATTLKLSHLVALVDPENEASGRVAEKIGMQLEREVVRPGGLVKYLYGMDLTRINRNL